MANPLLTPMELTQLQQFLLWMQLDIAPSSSAQPQPPMLPLSVSPKALPPPPASVPPINHSYQSLHAQVPLGLSVGSNGHPTACSTSAPEPFLGFSSLGNSMTGQVNQQRLTSPVATQPRPQLPSCGSHHHPQGPVQPQPFHQVCKIKDCISNINGEAVVRLAIKVYPPQVSSLHVALS